MRKHLNTHMMQNMFKTSQKYKELPKRQREKNKHETNIKHLLLVIIV